jgi:8-oxo-dGTP pyrophosphatase MutT (NUDIX family)
MGLPGGHRDPVDVDLTATAQRETMEEVGLDLRSGGRPLGLLPSVLVRPAVHGIRMTVTPFVFEMVGEASVAVGSEVEAVIWADLGPLARHERDTTFCFVRDGRQVERPAWDVDGHVVWGLTYEMLGSLLQSLKRLGGDNAAPAR